MDPVTAFIAIVWAFNIGFGLAILAKKIEQYNEKLDEINAAFDKMDLSADWAENIREESGD